MTSPGTAARPSISIAMATFNGARFIAGQLASLAAQDLLPVELVICDDGSTDTTLEIVAAFAEGAPFPVRVERNVERQGYRANFMNCAALCSGGIVCFCDQDDLWEPGKLSRIAPCFDDPAVMLVTHGALLIDENDAVIGTMPSEPLGDLFEHDPWPLRYGFALAFRRELLDHSDLWPESVSHFVPDQQVGHDRWIVFLAAALGKIVELPDLLVRYRQHSANVYGAGHKGGTQSRASRLAAIRREGIGLNLKLAAAESRVAAIEELVRRSDASGNDRLKKMLTRYRDLARNLKLRTTLHRSPRLVARAAALMRLIADRSYRRGTGWRFSRKALAKDLLVIMPLGGDRSSTDRG